MATSSRGSSSPPFSARSTAPRISTDPAQGETELRLQQ